MQWHSPTRPDSCSAAPNESLRFRPGGVLTPTPSTMPSTSRSCHRVRTPHEVRPMHGDVRLPSRLSSTPRAALGVAWFALSASAAPLGAQTPMPSVVYLACYA